MRGSKATGKRERKLPRSSRKSRVEWENDGDSNVEFFPSAEQAMVKKHVLNALRNAGEDIRGIKAYLVH